MRRQWVAATPEEMVRQRLLVRLVEQLQFPLGHLAVEVGLRQMPHLAHSARLPPLRRADILCYAPNIHPEYALFPLLLVECKAIALNEKVIRQTVGYNGYIQAFFIAAVNAIEERLGWLDPASGEYRFAEGMIAYPALIERLKAGRYRPLPP